MWRSQYYIIIGYSAERRAKNNIIGKYIIIIETLNSLASIPQFQTQTRNNFRFLNM